MSTPEPGHLLRVDRGSPTPEELAAVIAVLLAGSGPDDSGAPRRSAWGARARAARPRLAPGPGAWRASSLPR